MILYQLRVSSNGGSIDFTSEDDEGARSFATSHCRYDDCEVWTGERLVHRHTGEERPVIPVTGLAPPKAVG